jgi:N-acetylmuramoyl-L-alanine amidase
MNWKKLKAVDYIVIHCAATKEDQDIGVDEIRRWHRQRGWLDVGYHYVIRRDGTLEIGRPNDVPGAHARGFNHVSIGICLVGGVESDGKTPESNFTHAQWRTLEAVVKDQKKMHPDAKVLGHRDLPNVNKACPSFDAPAWWAEVSA